MKRILSLLFSFCLVAAPNAADQHVILITVDGFPARMLQDPKAHLPNIRSLAAEGTSAEGMKVSSPSVTWPNHTTLITGVRPRKHSVLFNGVLVRGGSGGQVRVNPDCTAAELVAVPTIFDFLHDSGLKTASVNWPCTRSSKSIDDDFPDSPDMLNFTTPRLRSDLVTQHILASEKQEDFAKIGQPERDEIWTKTACFLIRNRMPNFMSVHLLNTDSTHHKYGPQSMASYTALALADRFVGEIIAALKSAGLRDSTTILITADHGFANATNVLQPNVLLRKAGLLELSSLNQIVKARAQNVPEGGMGLIYLNDPATRDEDLKKVRELLAGQEGVAEVIGAERFAEFGMPDARQGGMADLILRPKMGYAVGGAAIGDSFVQPVTGAMSMGYHGYLAEEPLMNAVFVAAGPNIKRGQKIGMIENVDIAPTIMRLLGQKLANGDGKILQQILTGN
jgi:predicted AlkP superfamily pyrophosphatase or phosphodiesterase